jgi:hypothetical protein
MGAARSAQLVEIIPEIKTGGRPAENMASMLGDTQKL